MGRALSSAAKVITAKTRFPPSRKMASASPAAERRHAHHVGEIVHAWNCAHASLFLLFYRIAADGDYDLAIGLWHTIQNDKTQRQMLESAVLAKMPKRKSYKTAILWAIAKMNELSAYRNDAAHAEILVYYDELVPGISNRKQTAERLSERPLEKHWRQLKGDLHAVANYVGAIDFSLWMDMPRPLSRRPRLLLARSTSQQTQERHRRAKKAARGRQRRSSRP